MNRICLIAAGLICSFSNLLGQSVMISPSGPENLEVQKIGNAILSMKGQSQGTAEGSSIINMESNYGIVVGLSGISSKGISAINFSSSTENKFSIKHEHYYTKSLTSGNKFFSSLLINNGLEEVARFENDFFSVKKIGIDDQDPYYPLTFNNSFGDKISLNNRTCNYILGNCISTNEHYGIGLQNNLFQIFTKDELGDIVFGHGKSSSMTERFRLKGNGNIGIGTNTPNAPLQFASTIANRKIVMYENANNDHQYVGFGVNGNALRYQIDVPNGSHVFYAATNASSSNELMRVNSTGLGIGINNPAEKLHVVGNIRASSLAGTGTRNVSADANGTLTTSPQTKYLSIHPSKFKPSTGSDFSKINYSYDILGFNPSIQGAVFSSIELPQGSQVTSLKFYFVDNSSTDDLVFKLMRINLPTLNGGAFLVSEFQTPLPNNNTYRSGTVNLNSPLIIDNLNNAYFVVIEPRLQSSSGAGTWQVNTMLASSVVITYNE